MKAKYTEEEFRALLEKSQKPESTVFCPRCGKKLLFTDYGCGYEVKCPTEHCIKRSVRGL